MQAPESRRYSVYSLAGLRTQGREPFGSALRGDFPACASVFVPRSFPNTAARQFRILTGFPNTIFGIQPRMKALYTVIFGETRRLLPTRRSITNRTRTWLIARPGNGCAQSGILRRTTAKSSPPIRGIAIMPDSDNTGEQANA